MPRSQALEISFPHAPQKEHSHPKSAALNLDYTPFTQLNNHTQVSDITCLNIFYLVYRRELQNWLTNKHKRQCKDTLPKRAGALGQVPKLTARWSESQMTRSSVESCQLIGAPSRSIHTTRPVSSRPHQLIEVTVWKILHWLRKRNSTQKDGLSI